MTSFIPGSWTFDVTAGSPPLAQLSPPPLPGWYIEEGRAATCAQCRFPMRPWCRCKRCGSDRFWPVFPAARLEVSPKMDSDEIRRQRAWAAQYGIPVVEYSGGPVIPPDDPYLT